MARFVRHHPDIHVEMLLTGRLLNLVEEGVDLAVRAGKLDDSSLVARKVGTLEARLFASPGYLRRKGTPKTVADLGRHDCVLFRARHGRGTWELTGPKGVERVERRGRVSADDFAFIRQLLLAGSGIGLVPWTTCAEDIERGRLVRVLSEHAAPGRRPARGLSLDPLRAPAGGAAARLPGAGAARARHHLRRPDPGDAQRPRRALADGLPGCSVEGEGVAVGQVGGHRLAALGRRLEAGPQDRVQRRLVEPVSGPGDHLGQTRCRPPPR